MAIVDYLSLVLCCMGIVCANQLYALSNTYVDVLPDITGVLDVSNISISRCTLECMTLGCVSIFYNPQFQDCRLFNARPYNMKLKKGSGWTVRHREGKIISWVMGVIAVSSEFDETEWNGAQVVGMPDVYPKYEDNKHAWASSKVGLPHEWIQLRFAERLFIKQLYIYETYHAGGVKEISARRPDLGWEILWKTNKVEDIKHSRIFKPKIKTPLFKVDVIRITVDGTVCDSWPEIDAVKVVGDYKAY